MLSYLTTLLLVSLFMYQAWTVHSNCMNLTALSGNIEETYSGPSNHKYHKCWNIWNPGNRLLEIQVMNLDFENRHCNYVNLSVTIQKTGKKMKWCDIDVEREPVSTYSDVTVDFFVDSIELTPNSRKNFELHYKIDSSFNAVEGVKEAYLEAILYLKSNWQSWKWSNNIPKAVTALALDEEGAHFDEENGTDKHMLNQRELQMSLSLMRDNTHSNEQLATFINSVLSTCRNPRNFYGRDLVKLLEDKMAPEHFTHPSSYLALCNANEAWPDKAYENLINTFNRTFYIPFKRDYQAFAVMAVSCKIRQTGNHTMSPNGEELLISYEETIKNFKKLQNTNGGFGNVHRTALIVQALTASGHHEDSDWNSYNAMKFLMKSIKSPPTDFLSTYLILPLFKGKTLADIAFTNCSSSRGDVELVVEILDYFVPKMQVQYSLFTGDARDIIQTITVKVPENYTAFDVMEFVASKDKRYRFEYEFEFGKKVIYEMIGIPNEPEDGNFWLFYVKKSGTGSQFTHVTTGPDETSLKDGDHIAMWYTKGHALSHYLNSQLNTLWRYNINVT